MNVRVLTRDILRAIGLYLLLVAGGLLVVLGLTPIIGYLGYTDRPGPGGISSPSWSDVWAGIAMVLQWLKVLLPFLIVAALVIYLAVRVLERFGLPRLVVGLVSALVSGLVTLYLVASIGWYIAIGAPAVLLAAGLAAWYGGCLLPAGRGAGARAA
jgi:hypothetical protein